MYDTMYGKCTMYGSYGYSIYIVFQASWDFFLPAQRARTFSGFFRSPKWNVDILFMIWVFPKIGLPQIINSNRVVPSKPSILGYPYFWKYPYDWRFVCNSIRLISWGDVCLMSQDMKLSYFTIFLDLFAGMLGQSKKDYVSFLMQNWTKNLKSSSNELWKTKHPRFISNILISTIETT